MPGPTSLRRLQALRMRPSDVRRRPPDLAYADLERPPAAPLLMLALQHLATSLTLVAYVLAAAAIAGLDGPATQAAVTATLLAMALGTLLQAWAPGLGAGALLVHIPSPIAALLVATAIQALGPGALPLAGITVGLTALIVSGIIPRMRAVFPPAVAGVVICAGGLSLATPAFLHITGVGEAEAVLAAEAAGAAGSSAPLAATGLLVSLLTLGIIVILSVWGGRRVRLFALLAGVLGGLVAAAVLGLPWLPAPEVDLPVIGWPTVPEMAWSVDPGLLLAFVVLAAVLQLDVMGTTVLMQRMEDAEWRRPDLKGVGGAMRAVGVTNLAGGLLGGFPTALSTANVALCNISRVTARHVGLVVAAGLLLIALLPRVTGALTQVPQPIIGAIEVYACAFLTVAGLELIASRAMDTRGVFVVGMGLFAAVAAISVPDLAGLVPQSVSFLFDSPVILAGSTALLLNLLFRLGTRREQRLDLGGETEHSLHQRVRDFVELQGAAWSARREVIQRASGALIEAVDALQGAGGRTPAAVLAHFDEFNFDVLLEHQGPPLDVARAESEVASAAADRAVDEDDPFSEQAMERALAAASMRLLRHFADEVTTGTARGSSWIRLHFDH